MYRIYIHNMAGDSKLNSEFDACYGLVWEFNNYYIFLISINRHPFLLVFLKKYIHIYYYSTILGVVHICLCMYALVLYYIEVHMYIVNYYYTIT